MPKPETLLAYASILEKPQYYIHKGQKYLMPRSEIIDAAISALREVSDLRIELRSYLFDKRVPVSIRESAMRKLHNDQ